ncbi:MAG: molybdopterin-guanine dinucleotide biosynthesis protein MobB [Bacillota bacterium]
MIKIVVSGQASDTGKTTFIEKSIKNLKGRVAAIKCSMGKENEDFFVRKEKNKSDDSDTARYLKAGAVESILISSNLDILADKIDEAENILEEDPEYLIYEGNSILKFVRPQLVIYLKMVGRETKPSGEFAEKKADIIINMSKKNNKVTYFFDDIVFNGEKISCFKAHLIAEITGNSVGKVGRKISEQGVKIKNCQLGLF